MGAIRAKQQLQVVSQMGDWVLAAEEVRGKFAGRHRGRAAFRLLRRRMVTDKGERKTVFRVQCQVDGLILLTPGQAEKKAGLGDHWDLEDEDLAKSTLRLGKLIWAFRWVAVPFHMVLAAETPESWLKTDEESERFRRLAVSLVASLFLLFSLLQFLPEIKNERRVVFSEMVTLAIPKASNLGGIDTRLIQRPRSVPVGMADAAISDTSVISKLKPTETAPKLSVLQFRSKSIPTTAANAAKATTGPALKSMPGAGESLRANALKSELTAALSTMAHVSGLKLNKAGATGGAIGQGESILSAAHGQNGNPNSGLRLSGVPGGSQDPRQVALGGQGAGVGSGVGYGSGVHAKVSGQGGGMVAMSLGGLKVNQGLTQDEVGAVIQSHMDEIRYCYENAKVHSSYVDGKLQTFFTINGAGQVSTEKILASTVSSPVLEECVLRKLKNWRFPLPRGGVQVDISYPFVFRTLGSATDE